MKKTDIAGLNGDLFLFGDSKFLILSKNRIFILKFINYVNFEYE